MIAVAQAAIRDAPLDHIDRWRHILEALTVRFLQNVRCAHAVLQRHGRKRNEARLLPGCRSKMRVDQPRPARAFLGGKFVAEHVEPAADDLTVDLVVIEPLQSPGDVAERF